MSSKVTDSSGRRVLKIFLAVVILAIIVLFVFFFAKSCANSDDNATSSPKDSSTYDVDNTPSPNQGTSNTTETNLPTSSQIVVNPSTDDPVFIGYSSRIDFESNNNEYIVSAIKERLMEDNYLYVESGKLDLQEDYDNAFEINRSDEFIQVRIRTASKDDLIDKYYEEVLTFLYSNNAKEHKLPDEATADPTPTSSNKEYAYFNINLWNVTN